MVPKVDRQAKITDTSAQLGVDEDVPGLDVSMNHTAIMGMGKTTRGICNDSNSIATTQLALGDRAPQVHSLDEFHRQEWHSSILSALVEGHHPRVL